MTIEQEIIGLLREQLDELRLIRAALVAPTKAPPTPDPRDVAVIRELARLADDDLDFDAREVIQHAAGDHALAEALSKARITGTESLGLLLRRLRGQTIAGVRLDRAGRYWRLTRVGARPARPTCTTSVD